MKIILEVDSREVAKVYGLSNKKAISLLDKEKEKLTRELTEEFKKRLDRILKDAGR